MNQETLRITLCSSNWKQLSTNRFTWENTRFKEVNDISKHKLYQHMRHKSWVNWPLYIEASPTYRPIGKCQVQEIWTGWGIHLRYTVKHPTKLRGDTMDWAVVRVPRWLKLPPLVQYQYIRSCNCFILVRFGLIRKLQHDNKNCRKWNI